jgi:hypothetical protein
MFAKQSIVMLNFGLFKDSRIISSSRFIITFRSISMQYIVIGIVIIFYCYCIGYCYWYPTLKISLF